MDWHGWGGGGELWVGRGRLHRTWRGQDQELEGAGLSNMSPSYLGFCFPFCQRGGGADLSWL